MSFKRLLIANRGEIAIRIARAAADLGVETVAVHAPDDEASLHVRHADSAIRLEGRGAAAYLDIAQLVAVAQRAGCDAVHPGYGFLSENPAFARALAEAGITFVGPSADLLDLFGDKLKAKALAREAGVPVAGGTTGATTPAEAHAYFASLKPGEGVLVKAVAGGGGRGMRLVTQVYDLDAAMERCRSEALAAFGDGSVYVERLIPRARHIEVQVAGDGRGNVTHLWERECTLQRRHQKLVEIAPSPGLAPALRQRVIDAALTMARRASYLALGTFEFLVSEGGDAATDFIFIECNPRLQVEHTVTEAVTGVDLVRAQLLLAAGASLADAGLDTEPMPPRGVAIQLRVNMETMLPDGQALPSAGRLDAFDLPGGPGVRVDTFGYAGYETNTGFDSLIAKVVAHSPQGYAEALRRAGRALSEFRIAGVDTNIGFLKNVVAHPEVAADRVDTRFVERYIADLAVLSPQDAVRHFPVTAASTATDRPRKAVDAPADAVAIATPMPGLVVSVLVEPGSFVQRGSELLVVEAMKSELVIRAEAAGVVRTVPVVAGDVVKLGDTVAFITPDEGAAHEDTEADDFDPDEIRADLADLVQRKYELTDAARPDAVARRHAKGGRTARENVEDLCDPGTFVEYGGLILALQRGRRPMEELKRVSPADGMIAGMGTINGDLFAEDKTRCSVLAYDYTVFAGTQGFQAHAKKDRMFELAELHETPVVMFTEGGGGRPGDTDYVGVAGLNMRTFWHFGRLSAKVPLIGINSGRCFAGNAALLGSCDVVIATRNSSIGMAGPAMIEAGGLGAVSADEVGPVSVQGANGVIDLLVHDEADAVRAAKHYLSFFQGKLDDWTCPDQRDLRRAVPENRLRIYDIRVVLKTLADTGSLLELRSGFAAGMITALMRVEGHQIGVIANNPMHLGGAIDAPAADKAARFMQLCDAFDIPILSLCDTPGFMVGPESEKTATVRHFSRLFIIGANLDVPMFSVILRKAYGLGAVAMAAGSFSVPMFSIAWPTGEVGPMGLEGAVRLAYRKELEAIEDPAARESAFKQYVNAMYEQGKAMNAATFMELDDVIDPAETRRWIMHGIRTAKRTAGRSHGKKRPYVDAW
ncbi:carboxyl transferase domain-containing protein [Arvimicrobium flavum]|uniref:carboxyl transferase domain-containing protein n=1 Tax=Arvimicrobium flavum TaxID=3393320 RepID=UPI00237AD3AE|nr:carboxyl transferase domain-containing protein [Mesorhizobium shangrilense]